jgi:ABC-type transport system involved in Fe-S cluster assembly fused permease/ATPase subunit
MRRDAASRDLGPAQPRSATRTDWQTLRSLLPYLWQYRGRVLLALGLLVGAKLAVVGVPVVLKHLVDAVATNSDHRAATWVVPLGLLVAYGSLRLASSALTELRELVFARVTQRAVRTLALRVFAHLHNLSLRFHLERQTGGLTRDLERGTRGISSLVSYTLYSIVPTVVEIGLVMAYLGWHYEATLALIASVALVVYVGYTIAVTEWRTGFRRTMNELDSRANVRAVDSLLNYETVKYFGNEAYEAQRYDESLQRWEQAAIRSQTSLSALNVGQAAIIAVAVTLMVWRATVGVVEGRMTLGDLVLVNAFMIQLYMPLNFLGVLYREIKQSLADMERLFGLLDAHREVDDAPEAPSLVLRGPPALNFENVCFAYDPARPILHDVSFVVPPGTTTAVVGPSGAGKSTLARLLFRFYDVTGGAITLDGRDVRGLTQASVRAVLGIVPQDTVLFNDTLRYNVAYGRPSATQAEIEAVAEAAQLGALIRSLPAGWETVVGERGLKLSGGEKQRVAIARMLLKNPPVLVLDEATSALDSRHEAAIQEALQTASEHRTTLVIAHRLSTIVTAEQILVLEAGRIVERGNHEALLAQGGVYAAMWAMQAESVASAA